MAQQTNNSQDEINLRELLNKYLRNWYWFVVSVLICLSLAVLYICRKTPVYNVSSTIMIRDSESSGLSGLAQMDALNLLGVGGSKSVTDEIEIYNSRAIMEQTLRALQLQTEYRKKKNLRWFGQYPSSDLIVHYPQQFCDTMQRSVRMELTCKGNTYKLKVKYGYHFLKSTHTLHSLNEPIETCIGTIEFEQLRPIEKGDKYRIKTTPMLSLVDSYRSSIKAKQIKKGSNIVSISTDTDMPRRGQNVINKLTELYNFETVVDKTTTTKSTQSFLEERLQRIAFELDSAELAVERYKSNHNITSLSDEAALYLEGISKYQESLVETETQLNLIEYIKQFVSDEANEHSLIPANMGITDAALVTLIDRYNQLLLRQMKISRTATENNPAITQLNEQLSLMRNNILTSIAGVRDGLLITKADLQQQQNIFNSRIADVPQQEREYIALKREQQIKQTLYVFLYQKKEENDLALISTVTPTRLIDQPQRTPDPIAPRVKIIVLLSIILGLFIPIGVLFLLDLLNNTIRNKQQYTDLLTTPIVGDIPYSKGHSAGTLKASSTLAESIYSVLNNLHSSLPQTTEGKTFVVTSAIGGEGKTFVAVHIAMALAASGKKTVLIEGNLRKPQLARVFNLPNSNHLMEYLTDTTLTAADVLTTTSIAHLDVITSGCVTNHPSEYLQSPRIGELIESLRQQYDYIIIDTAPVYPIADTFSLNHLTDVTLFVSRADKTPCDMANYINSLHEQHRLNNMVCVLNGTKEKHNAYIY